MFVQVGFGVAFGSFGFLLFLWVRFLFWFRFVWSRFLLYCVGSVSFACRLVPVCFGPIRPVAVQICFRSLPCSPPSSVFVFVGSGFVWLPFSSGSSRFCCPSVPVHLDLVLHVASVSVWAVFVLFRVWGTSEHHSKQANASGEGVRGASADTQQWTHHMATQGAIAPTRP